MKRMLTLILVLSLILLCGCGAQSEATEPSTVPETQISTEAPTEAPAQETEAPTEAPTEGPTEPLVYTNPLTGETLDAPLESRIFAITINNIGAALPHYGVSKADLFFEMFVNDSCTRGLALFADVTEAEAVGSVRSLRYNFTDICQSFDAIVVHASGSDAVLNDLHSTTVPNISVESEIADYYFRDNNRLNNGYAWEHCLFVKGPDLKEYAASKGISVTKPAGTTYGLNFTENGAPEDGEDANVVTINMIHGSTRKTSIMTYDPEIGQYTFKQYNRDVYDGWYDVRESYENVIVLLCPVHDQRVKSTTYHVAELTGSGEGYFACDGKIIPILWSRESDTSLFQFTRTDGTPLELGIGSSYISLAPLTSTVEYE